MTDCDWLTNLDSLRRQIITEAPDARHYNNRQTEYYRALHVWTMKVHRYEKEIKERAPNLIGIARVARVLLEEIGPHNESNHSNELPCALCDAALVLGVAWSKT